MSEWAGFDYRDLDDRAFEVFRDGESMFAVVQESKFPKTYAAMFGFIVKCNALKTGMFETIDSNNPYAFRALLRCFCDHYLKFTYVWVRFLREKSDAVGQEYFSYCGAIEARDYLKALVESERLLGRGLVSDYRRAIDRVYPSAREMSIKELEAASAKFRYRSILRFLADGEKALLGADAPFLASIVPVYAELSSFVHGGPWSDIAMQSFAKPEAIAKCEEEVCLVVQMAGSVFMITAMAVSREFPEYATLAWRAGEILRSVSPLESAEDS